MIMRKLRRQAIMRGLLLRAAVGACSAALVAACGGRGALHETAAAPAAPVAVDSCAETAFATQLWAPVIAPSCYGCHMQYGLAPQSGSRFVLAASNTPHYIAANLQAVRDAAARLIDGEPSILVKPTQQVPHGGGHVLDDTGAGYQALAAFLARTDLTPGCEPAIDPATVAALTVQTPQQIVRGAAVRLAARPPSATELEMAANGGLMAALDSVLQAPAFGTYAKTIYNDIFLLNQFTGDNLVQFDWMVMGGPSINGGDLYSAVVQAFPLAQNNLELVSHIVLTDRPYTDILNANYRMVNAISACTMAGAGHRLPFTQSSSCLVNGAAANTCTQASFDWSVMACPEFLPTPITNPQFSHPPPVVGALNDTALLTVFSTTPSNRNRHRAAMIYQTFLGMDIMSLGPQLPPGSSAGADPNGPPLTMTQPSCMVCHKLIDPLAGTLQNYDPHGIWTPSNTWAPDMFPPGFEGTPMPAGTSGEPAAWLAQQIVADPRFAYGGVALWYTALSGQQLLSEPAANDPNYLDSLRLRLAQNDFLWDQANRFAADGFSVRRMVARLLAAPQLATVGVAPGTSGAQLVQAAAFDHAQRIYPETLNQVLTGVSGQMWFNPAEAGASTPTEPQAVFQDAYLTNDFLVSAGGIDSHKTLTRNTAMSTVAAAISNFMAASVPCATVAQDFERPRGQRLYFPLVSATDVPDGGAGTANIVANLVALHLSLLGETVAGDGPEVAADLALFTQVRQNHAGQTALAAACQTAQTTTDAHQTLTAWSAVLAVYLQDFKFLYQ